MKFLKKFSALLLLISLLLSLTAGAGAHAIKLGDLFKDLVIDYTAEEDSRSDLPDENGKYTSKDEVALYIHTYGHLPSNYITKNEAKKLGWDSYAGNLWKVTDHMSIGGDYFGNFEGQLPAKKGRKYTECDIDYTGGKRNAKRIIFSNDGLVYYTEDHYNTFELLYGEE